MKITDIWHSMENTTMASMLKQQTQETQDVAKRKYVRPRRVKNGTKLNLWRMTTVGETLVPIYNSVGQTQVPRLTSQCYQLAICDTVWQKGWWRWTLVSPDGVAPSRIVCVSASVNLPLHHKVQKFSSGTRSSAWSRKNGRKMVVVVVWQKAWKNCKADHFDKVTMEVLSLLDRDQLKRPWKLLKLTANGATQQASYVTST